MHPRDLVNKHVLADQSYLVESLLELEADQGVTILKFDYIDNENYYEHRETSQHISGVEFDALDLEDKHNIYEQYPTEVLAWYLVTEWLADKLRDKGEAILHCHAGTWWGRTTFGQLIEDDGVIEAIAKEID